MPGPVKRKAPPARRDGGSEHDLFERVQAATDYLRSRVPSPPEVGIILGSGLGAVAEAVETASVVPYAAIPHFPATGVAGHAGRLLLGRLEGKGVAVMQGRPHYYEGHSLQAVGFPVRVLAALGVRGLLLTNVAGGLSPRFTTGDLMLIGDVLNLMGDNPLRGPHDERLGPRFPDMREPFSPRLLRLARLAGRRLRIPLRQGVYAALAGPSYETAAEVRMLRTLGADAVGMSTVPEAIVARHAGIPELLGISCITNLLSGRGGHGPVSHAAVLEVARRAEERFVPLVRAILAGYRAAGAPAGTAGRRSGRRA